MVLLKSHTLIILSKGSTKALKSIQISLMISMMFHCSNTILTKDSNHSKQKKGHLKEMLLQFLLRIMIPSSTSMMFKEKVFTQILLTLTNLWLTMDWMKNTSGHLVILVTINMSSRTNTLKVCGMPLKICIFLSGELNFKLQPSIKKKSIKKC